MDLARGIKSKPKQPKGSSIDKQVNNLWYLQLGFYIHRSYIYGFNQLWIQNIQENIAEISKKQNLNLARAGNNLHGTHIVLTTMYFVLDIISNLEMI